MEKLFFKFCLLFVLILITAVHAVDRGNFKTCEQSGFCKRHRAKSEVVPYHVDPQSVRVNDSAIEAILVMANEQNRLQLVVAWLEDSTLRIFMDEYKNSLRQRFHPVDSLDGEPKHQKFLAAETNEKFASFVTGPADSRNPTYKIVLQYLPFRLDVFVNGAKEPVPVISVNSRQLLKFEHFRNKDDGRPDGDGFWEETFKSHSDSKLYGSSSVGLDISFVGFRFAFGLPEHADSFALRNTINQADPYRLYNLDVFEYELYNTMALYGSIPFVVLPSKLRTVGALWLNAAETWVDVDSSTADKGFFSTLISQFQSSQEVPQVDLHFMSESGVVDLFLMLGPKPNDLARQNSKLTGVFPLPPLFALGYHQCRWNYNDQKDLLDVHSAFDAEDIPVDVLWLDIEHTDGKRYFTWDLNKFPTPRDMISELENKGRRLVTIIDPHLKADDGYSVFKEARDLGFLVKKGSGSEDYSGFCWPGSSGWLDYLNPAAREFWASKFTLDQYKYSTERLFTWNDMNEPSVFSGPEVTMHKDAVHYQGFEHREIHNAYGFYMVMATIEGQKRRSNNKLRPFILTRAFFVGSQRYSSAWTGDNTADWGHLKASIPMLLSLSVAGVPHVGADVGGFFGNPDSQLLVRWYQAGAFQPFFRAHAHIDTRRREPWLFDNETKSAIREAVQYRYKFLPFWYTLFYEHSKTGAPPMRPLWYDFSEDENGYDEERQWMVGNALLVRPVTEPDVKQTSLYLPGKTQAWYEWYSHKMHISPGAVYTDTPLNKIPLYQRGGTIVPVRERLRRSSKAQANDPLTLYIATELDKDFANGTIYLDSDGESLDADFLYWAWTYRKQNDVLYTITSRQLDKAGTYDPDVWVERIVIRGVRYYPRNVHMYYDDFTPEDLDFEHDRDERVIVIRKPGCYVETQMPEGNANNSILMGPTDEPCVATDCFDRGTCVGSKRIPICLCSLGFAGTRCQDTFCDPVRDCNGKGWCVGMSSQHTCLCNLGWTGEKCEQEIQGLSPAPSLPPTIGETSTTPTPRQVEHNAAIVEKNGKENHKHGSSPISKDNRKQQRSPHFNGESLTTGRRALVAHQKITNK